MRVQVFTKKKIDTNFYTLHDSDSAMPSKRLDDGSFNIVRNGVGTFDFFIDYQHPAYEQLENYASFIYVLKNDKPFFCGRIFNKNQTGSNEEDNLFFYADVKCESMEAMLNDVYRVGTSAKTKNWGKYPNNIKNFIADFATAKSLEILVNTDATFNGGNFELILEEEGNFKDAIDDYCKKAGGDWFIDFTDDFKLRFNYVAKRSESSISVAYRENMDLLSYGEGDVASTRIYATGKDGLTFKALNGNKDYVEDAYAIGLYGLIEREINDDRFTIAANLFEYAKNELAKDCKPATDMEITFLDEMDVCEIGTLVNVIQPMYDLAYGFNIYELQHGLYDTKNLKLKIASTDTSYLKKIQGK